MAISITYGCQRGTAIVDGSRWQLRADRVRMLGRESPARELGIFDAAGNLLGFVDLQSPYRAAVFGPPHDERTLADAVDIVAAVWLSFMEQDGSPEGCVVP